MTHLRDTIRSYPMVVLLLLTVAAIWAWDHYHPLFPQDESEQKYGFIIAGEAKQTPKCDRYETDLIDGGKVYLYLLSDSTRAPLQYGDTVVARTSISWYHGVGRAFARQYLVLKGQAKIPIQLRLYQRLQDGGLSGDELATVGALTLGYKEDIDPEVRRHFQASGAAHVLAVSGLHTGILYGILIGLLSLGGRIRPRYENQFGRAAIGLIIIVAMWTYAWITGMTPSVVRAVLMVSIVEVGRMIYRSSFGINSIAAAAVLILLVRPTDLWSVSFQLSFAATAAIVLLVNAFGQWIPYRKLRSTPGGRVLNWIIGTVIVSIAAQLGTLPITMYYFGQISTYFLFTNLIVLPIATLLVPCGLISIALGGTTIGILWTKITWILSWAMNHAVGWIEGLPYSTIPVSIDTMMVVIYYILFIGFCRAIQPIQKV